MQTKINRPRRVSGSSALFDYRALMPLVAGIDSSTQSVKVVVRDAESGRLIRHARAAHPDATEVDPWAWWGALGSILGNGMLDGVSAIAVGGQQHGMVALDEFGEVVRPALLWNDTRSAPDAVDLVRELGGAAAWADAVGSVPVASFTVTKLRWLARCEPENARRTAQVLLPHDWLTWQLAGCPEYVTTDRGDASGTGYWSPSQHEYRADLLELALGRCPALPEVMPPAALVGHTPDGVALSVGTGDNMAAALALDLQPGDVVVSLGTSGTAFAVSEVPTADPTGEVAGFADATGRYLPLVCTLNAARVLTATADLLGVDLDGLAELATQAEPGSGGLVLLPYLEGERTPNLPDASGSLHGITRHNYTPSNVARAAHEGMLAGLADAIESLQRCGVKPQRLLLVGGAAVNPAVSAVAGTIFAVPVLIPSPGEYVADGAARQAAWALAATAAPPLWTSTTVPVQVAPNLQPKVRTAYANARDALFPDVVS